MTLRTATELEKRVLRAAAKDGRLRCPPSVEPRLYMTSLYMMARKQFIYRDGPAAYITENGRAAVAV